MTTLDAKIDARSKTSLGAAIHSLQHNPRARFWSVLLGHFSVDTFNGMVSVLMAFMSLNVLQMTNTQIGFAISAYQLVGAVSQPFFGLWCDRSGGRWLGAGGVAWTISLLMLAMMVGAVTQSYALMLIPFVVASLGSAAFHPVGTMHAGGVSGKSSAVKLSWFFLAGQLGLALGPGLTGIILDSAATHNNAFTAGLAPFSNILVEHGNVSPLLILSLFGLPGVALMALTLPSRAAYLESHKAAGGAGAAKLAIPMLPMLLLAITVTLRAVSNPGAVAFIPRLFQEKGWTAAEYGLVTSAFWLASGITGVIFGQLAVRFGDRIVTAVSLILSVPMLFLLPASDGFGAFALALLAGGLSGGSHSLLVAMSQRLMPKSRGFASGATLGFMFGVGAIGTLIIGTLSDHIGLSSTFQVVAIITLVAGLMSFTLRNE